MLKTGKDEIIYLLECVFDKYESETGMEIVRNTNRRNYEDVARVLSQISGALPETSERLGHEPYPPDPNKLQVEYPHGAYDITGGQLKDAYNGVVSRPRQFLVDACYIYLYGKGRKAFEQQPVDANLLLDETDTEREELPQPRYSAKKKLLLIGLPMVLLLLFAVLLQRYIALKNAYHSMSIDMHILPYQPTAEEIEALEGVWLVYIGSPQARVSDANRYQQVVANVMDVKYKDGYFTFVRYGANFDHTGYLQYENQNTVSIHSYLSHRGDSVSSPRLSLLRLDEEGPFHRVISSSWNFDSAKHNDIIGIREIYMKQGSGGCVEEIINTLENSVCKCKIVRWRRPTGNKTFQLKNISLNDLPDTALRIYLDENSILPRDPTKPIVISKN